VAGDHREALREAVETRPKAKGRQDAGLCFLTVQGNRWVRVRVSKTNPDQYGIHQ
jgi:hypothetical protein